MKRCPKLEPETENLNPIFSVPKFSDYPNAFLMPDKINIKESAGKWNYFLTQFWKNIQKPDQSPRKSNKKRKHDENNQAQDPDSGILWQVNFEKFNRFLRDQFIVSYFGSTYKEVGFENFLWKNRLLKIWTFHTEICWCFTRIFAFKWAKESTKQLILTTIVG